MTDEYVGTDQEHHIVAVYEDGLRLELDDGSLWDIPPGPSTKVAVWYPPQRVLVEHDGAAYSLTNCETSGPDVVEALFDSYGDLPE